MVMYTVRNLLRFLKMGSSIGHSIVLLRLQTGTVVAHSHHEEIEDSQDNSASRGSWAFALLGYSIVVAFVFLCGVYVYRHRDNFGFLWEASLPETFVAGLCILASYLLNAFQMRLFLRKIQSSSWIHSADCAFHRHHSR